MSVTALLLGLGLLAANAFFVASEFALLAARRSRLEQLAQAGDRAATSAVAGLRELSLMLAGAQLGITMASFGLGAVAEPAVERALVSALDGMPIPSGVSHTLAFALTLLIVVFLHMVVGEMAPKSWAISDPEGSALLLAPPFRAFVVVFRPFIRLLNALANGVVKLLGVEPQDERAMVHNPEDLVLLVLESETHGELGTYQRELLTRALDLSGLDAESAMIPRADIVGVPSDAGVEELERVASATGRSRLVVYDGELDHIRGVLHVKDILRLEPAGRLTASAATIARPALVTPESRRLEELMVDMREQRQHIAVVVDEFGTVTGLVALEDLIEELIGDFEDETDRRRLGVRTRRDGTLVVPGQLRLHELRGATGVELPEGEWETVAGYVISRLGRLPEQGDRVTFDGGELVILRMDDHRVVDLALRVDPARGAPPEAR
jgi:CBS domain containing-hemolysin-like protein